MSGLPEVRSTYPFLVAVAIAVNPAGLGDSTLLPTAPSTVVPMVGVLVSGRMPDPARADEAVVDQNAQRRFHLDIGSTMSVSQTVSKLALAAILLVIPAALALANLLAAGPARSAARISPAEALRTE